MLATYALEEFGKIVNLLGERMVLTFIANAALHKYNLCLTLCPISVLR